VTKRPNSSHARKMSPDLTIIEKDIEKLKKENYLVSQRLERFISNKISEIPDKKQNLFTFINNPLENQKKNPIEEKIKLEKTVKKLMARLEDRKQDLQKAFSLLKMKEFEVKEAQDRLVGLKEEFLEIFEVTEEKFQMKFRLLEEKLEEKEKRIEEFERILEEIRIENIGLMKEKRFFDEKVKRNEEEWMRNMKKLQNQMGILLNKKEMEIVKLMKEIEGNNEEKKDFVKKNEEKFRGVYAELLNVKLEKKSLLAKNLMMKNDQKERKTLENEVKKMEKERKEGFFKRGFYSVFFNRK